MQNELNIVRDVSAKLDAASISYMLTGSMAMNFYTEPRMTRVIHLVRPSHSASMSGWLSALQIRIGIPPTSQFP